MMIKPSIEQLTKEKQCNRYTLVIASAKSARYVTAKQKIRRREKEKANEKAKNAEMIETPIITKGEKQPLPAELYEEKPVSAGIQLIHENSFSILDPDTGMASAGADND